MQAAHVLCMASGDDQGFGPRGNQRVAQVPDLDRLAPRSGFRAGERGERLTAERGVEVGQSTGGSGLHDRRNEENAIGACGYGYVDRAVLIVGTPGAVELNAVQGFNGATCAIAWTGVQSVSIATSATIQFRPPAIVFSLMGTPEP